MPQHPTTSTTLTRPPSVRDTAISKVRNYGPSYFCPSSFESTVRQLSRHGPASRNPSFANRLFRMSSKKPTGKTQRSAIADVVAREYTIHMHKRVSSTEQPTRRKKTEY